MELIKRFTKNLPMLASAILLAIAVWVLAVTNTDPVERRALGRPVPLEIIGQDPSLIITSEVPEQVSVILSAPVSAWRSTLSATNAVRAVVDLSGLSTGTYDLPVKLQISARPVKVETLSPDVVNISLDRLFSKSFPITLFQSSSPAVGYEAGKPEMSEKTALVNGPASLVEKVAEVRATLDISQIKDTVDREVILVPLDENGARVLGVNISPEKIRIRQEITQRGGYKNVTVKVVTAGQIASGYRLTNISASPLVITIFSTDPEQIATLPGFIETQPLDLTGESEELEVSLPLNLPTGVIVVGESTIKVSVSISPIEGSITLSSLPIEFVGSSPAFQTIISPDRVDVILSGPLPELDSINSSDVKVLLDLTDKLPGVYQIEPQVQVGISSILVESILPATIEVEIKLAPAATPQN